MDVRKVAKAAGIGCDEREAKEALVDLLTVVLSVPEDLASGYASLLIFHGLAVLPASLAREIASLVGDRA